MYPEVEEFLDEAQELIEENIGEEVTLELLDNLDHLLFKVWEAGFEEALGKKNSK